MKPFEKYPDECQQIISICQRLYQRNMLAAADGNVSIKVSSEILNNSFENSKGLCRTGRNSFNQ